MLWLQLCLHPAYSKSPWSDLSAAAHTRPLRELESSTSSTVINPLARASYHAYMTSSLHLRQSTWGVALYGVWSVNRSACCWTTLIGISHHRVCWENHLFVGHPAKNISILRLGRLDSAMSVQCDSMQGPLAYSRQSMHTLIFVPSILNMHSPSGSTSCSMVPLSQCLAVHMCPILYSSSSVDLILPVQAGKFVEFAASVQGSVRPLFDLYTNSKVWGLMSRFYRFAGRLAVFSCKQWPV